MHDAPGGNQNLDSFKNKDGTQLKTGDIKEFSMPWGFINPFIEKDLLDEGYLTPEGFKQNPDIKKILEILKKNNLEMSKHPSLSKWMTNNTFLETHMLTLKESYNFTYFLNDRFISDCSEECCSINLYSNNFRYYNYRGTEFKVAFFTVSILLWAKH